MELSLCNMTKNAFRMVGERIAECVKACFRTPKCHYYNNGKMYHCLCNRCEQVFCKDCHVMHVTFEESSGRVCEMHRPVLQNDEPVWEYRTDE